ncbi:MAG TPA: hypothetical protein VES66_03775 [Terriglobales bacterium]|nr:hypothetical protein [Terriglobales bacterium]
MGVTKRQEYLLKLKVQGPGVRPGAITVPDLLRICQATQDAVNRQAEAMRGGVSLRPGPKSSVVYEECTLELLDIRKGSTVLPFRLAKPQQHLPIPEAQAFGAEVVTQVVATVKKIGSTYNGADFEAGVLASLKTMGEVLERGNISRIEWIVPLRRGGRKKLLRAVFDRRVRDCVIERMKTPLVRPEKVEGVLEMADFKEQEHKCRIHPPIGQPVVCTFSPEQEEEVYEALRKPVRVAGTAKINPNSGRIDELAIQSIVPVEQLLVGAEDFFSGHSIEELAQAQGVRPLENPKVLAGGWPQSDNLDDFLEEIYSSRRI